jgi:sRNA-binding carbon storage regulator CsrA
MGGLVLARREGDEIFIGEDIRITVLDIYEFNERPYVRLRIEAPRGQYISKGYQDARRVQSSIRNSEDTEE